MNINRRANKKVHNETKSTRILENAICKKATVRHIEYLMLACLI